MISTRSTGFDIGVCLGLNLGPHGCARCPVELGAGPGQIEPLRLANERLKLRSWRCRRSSTQLRLQPPGPPKQPQPGAKSQGNLHPNNASVPSNMPLVLYKPWRSLGGAGQLRPAPSYIIAKPRNWWLPHTKKEHRPAATWQKSF